MTRVDAIQEAEKFGYTIRYDETRNELRFRKPGAAMSPLNQPYEYCRVFKKGRSWNIEERVDPKVI